MSDDNRWYLLAVDGYVEHPDAPFELSEAAVDGCPKNFVLEVRPPGGEWTSLVQGESTSMVIDNWRYDLTVARSVVQGMYDASPPFAWWATSAPVE